MGTSDVPKDPQNTSDLDSDRTLSTGASVGAAAGQIGPYRLLQMIGEGGMGEVWLTEQTTPIHRTVALKLIKAGMDTKAVVARFESERQALALMDHPNIARVFDAGSTAEGKPFFVMEYVPGLPITEYCDKHRLTVNERLVLLMQVCDGVQHAHQKAIIHRDLKPSNVLVVEQDGKPVPKIIDFGLAKATAHRLTDKTMFTEIGVMIGTPEYMSPEQLDQREQNIDTRTDVYSLGVILYQLLVGVLPFEAKGLRAAGLEAVLRALREQEPLKPSTKIRSIGDASNASAEKRKENPNSFARRLQGELDWITMKALEKDRNRRYGSAAELGADIQRHLHDEPVIAHPPSTTYRARKYVHRHRLGVGIALAGVLLLVAFAIAQAVQIRRITRERDRANRITDFMTSIFKVSDPSEARGNSITAREILDKSSKEIETGLKNDPQLQAQLMGTMGQVYVSMGLFPQGQAMLERAVQTGRRIGGPDDPNALRAMSYLSFLLLRQGRYADAEKLCKEAIPGQQRVFGPNDTTTLNTRRYCASVLEFEGKYSEADSVITAVLADDRRALGSENAETLRAMNVLANILDDEKRLPEAEKLYRETLTIQQRTLGPDAPETLTTASNLAGLLQEQGRLDDAEKLERETLATRSRVLGPEHPDTLATKSNLANTLDSEGRFSEAEAFYREIIDSQSRVLGKENPDTLITAANFANTLQKAGKLSEAEKIQRQTLEAERRVLGPDHPETDRSVHGLAYTLLKEGKFDEALKIYNDRVVAFRQKSDRSAVARALYSFACGAAIAGHVDEAFDLLRQSISEGYANFNNMKDDPDLSSLRGDPRFSALLKEVEQRSKDAPAH